MDVKVRHKSVLRRMKEVGTPVEFVQSLIDYDEDDDLLSNEQLIATRGHVVELSGDVTDYSDMSLTENSFVTLLFVPETLGEVPPLDASLIWKGISRKVKKRMALQLGAKVVLA